MMGVSDGIYFFSKDVTKLLLHIKLKVVLNLRNLSRFTYLY